MKNAVKPKALMNAIEYAGKNTITENDVIAIVDLTVFESAKEAVIFTKDSVYIHSGRKHLHFNYFDLKGIEQNKLSFNNKEDEIISFYSATNLVNQLLNEVLSYISKKGYTKTVDTESAANKILNAVTHANSVNADSFVRFELGNDTNEQQRQSLLAYCAPSISTKEILAFVDTTLRRSGSEGLIITDKALFDSDPSNKPIYFEYLEAFYKTQDSITVKYTNGNTVENSYPFALLNLIKALLDYITNN